MMSSDFIKLNITQNFDKCLKKLCPIQSCISVVLLYFTTYVVAHMGEFASSQEMLLKIWLFFKILSI